GHALGKSLLAQTGMIDHLAVVERIEVADVDDNVRSRPGGVAETALGNAAEQLHLSALEHADRLLGAGAGPLALGTSAGRLAVPGARTAADALLALELVNADVDS